MASPAHCGERATGYGVALLLVLFGQISQDKLLQSLAPQVSVLNGNVPFADEPVPSKRHRHA
jgi:probable aminopeptidase NPEPL1